MGLLAHSLDPDYTVHAWRGKPGILAIVSDCDDLEVRKIYQVLPDQEASQEGYLRVIDESGEDYLYPADYFVPVELPDAVAKTLALSA